MLFSILPRRAYTIECNFSKEEFHSRLNEVFNAPEISIKKSFFEKILIRDTSVSYMGSGNEFEIDKTIINNKGRISHISGTGTIDALNEKYLMIHVAYSFEDKIMNWALPLISIINLFVCIVFLIQMTKSGLNNRDAVLLFGFPGIFAPWLFRYSYALQIEALHKHVLEALK